MAKTPLVAAVRATGVALVLVLALLWGAVGASAQAGLPQEGYTLAAPLSSTDTLLVDLNGSIAHIWPSTDAPGLAAYLLPDGNLLRTVDDGSLQAGGAGGGFDVIDWNGQVLWQYRYSTPDVLQHHDVAVLENGNVLLIAWERKTQAQAVAAGRDPATVGNVLRPDHLIEVRQTGPVTGEIVWEWHVWDHLVQDFDPGQANFGVVADHPQLVDINFPPGGTGQGNMGDWMHTNAVAFHPVMDQIVLSVHHFNELWIIDHSTTSAEAAGPAGDLLYRWGNPRAYGHGTPADQMLWGQHDVQWIAEGSPGAGHLLVFNNGGGRPGGPYSSVDEIATPWDALTGSYSRDAGQPFGPSDLVWSYVAPDPHSFFAMNISGAERQPNGSTLITEGPVGYVFEVNEAGQMLWDWQNTVPQVGNKRIFKTRRYQNWLWGEAPEISVAIGDALDLSLLAGSAQSGRLYVMAGSISGTSPGLALPGGIEVPLNPDALTDLVLASPFGPVFVDFVGFLDGQGMAAATLDTLGPVPSYLAGVTMHFAYVLAGPVDFVSNPVAVTFVP